MDVASNKTKPYYTIPNLTNPNQLYIFSKTAKTNQILMKISQKFQMDVFSNQTKTYQTKLYQTEPTLNLL